MVCGNNLDQGIDPTKNNEASEVENDGCKCSSHRAEENNQPTENSCGCSGSHNSCDDAQGDLNGDDSCCADSLNVKIDELNKKLNEAEQKRDEYLKMAQRTQADFDNYRRRNKNAILEAHKASAAETVEAFLPILDNMERAYDQAVSKLSEEDGFVKGLEMMIRQFKDCLARLNVVEIEALNKPFDPEFHEAFMQVMAEEGQEPNTVVEVLEKGYMIEDKVLRYAKVKVAN